MRRPVRDGPVGSASSARPAAQHRRAEVVALTFLLPLVENVILAILLPVRYEGRNVIWQYFHGVYRPRILGRELVVGIGNAVDALNLPIGVLRSHPQSLLAGFIIVNSVALFVAAPLLYHLTARRDRSLTPLYLVMIVAMAGARTVTTPYDFLSYALAILLFDTAIRRRLVWAVVLTVLAMCTRESAFVAIAAVLAAAARLAPGERSTEPLVARARRVVGPMLRDRTLVAVVLAGLVTYAVLHVVFAEGGSLAFFEHVTHRFRARTYIGMAIAAASFAAVRWTSRRQAAEHHEIPVRRRILWLLSVPYLVTCVVGGIWSEAPRLLMPVLIGEALIVANVVTAGTAPLVRQPADDVLEDSSVVEVLGLARRVDP
jgi:hypothetical protein